MTSYRISGIKKTESILFSAYLSGLNPHQLRKTAQQISQNITAVENEFESNQVSLEQLPLNNRTSHFNIRGLTSLILNTPHRYCDIFKIVRKKQMKFKKLKNDILLLKFSASQKLNHKIHPSSPGIVFTISFAAVQFPQEYFEYLAIILFKKLTGEQISQAERESFLAFEGNHFEQTVHSTQKNTAAAGRGRFYNLVNLFFKMNREYFKNRLKVPELRWSSRANFHRLGSYDHTHNRITISRIFDQKEIPNFVVESIVYHEMLHIIHPWEQKNGRRIIHSKEFKADEKKFYYYAESKRWIAEELPKLAGGTLKDRKKLKWRFYSAVLS